MLIRNVINATGRRPPRQRFGKLRRDPQVFELVQRVAWARRVSLSALLKSSRGPDRHAAARQLAMYLVHVVLGRSQETIAELFGRDRTTVAHACQRLEDEREDALEAEIAAIEKCRARVDPRWKRMEFKYAA